MHSASSVDLATSNRLAVTLGPWSLCSETETDQFFESRWESWCVRDLNLIVPSFMWRVPRTRFFSSFVCSSCDVC